MELIVNDVYQARWKERTWGDQKDHCFEGLLVVIKDNKDQLWLVDTYWGIGTLDNKKYLLQEALDKFDLKYYCNLDNITPINKYEQNYYSDSDIIVLHTQHACVESCTHYHIINGAKRSQLKMVEVLNKKIEDSKHTVEWETRHIKEYSDKLAEVISGNLDIYI